MQHITNGRRRTVYYELENDADVTRPTHIRKHFIYTFLYLFFNVQRTLEQFEWMI